MGLFIDDNGDYKILRIGVVIFVIVVLLTISYPFIMHQFPCIWNEKADIGAMFGLLSALFTGLAFAATFVTLLSHQQEIKKQSERINMDIFNETYLRMRQELKQYVRSIMVDDISPMSTNPYSGRDALNVIIKRIDQSTDSDREIIKQFGDKIMAIIEYVDSSQLVYTTTKTFCISELFRQLDTSELKILFHYFRSHQNMDSVKNIVNKYNIKQFMNNLDQG